MPYYSIKVTIKNKRFFVARNGKPEKYKSKKAAQKDMQNI